MVLLVLAAAISISAQTGTELNNAFKKASAKYNVPVDLLKSISYAETRFTNIQPSNIEKEFSQQPSVYGMMALRNDNWFGHSLLNAAKLINASPEEVAKNVNLNIMASAALLSKMAKEKGIDRSDLNNWKPVLEEFSGIPQTEIKPFYSFEVFRTLKEGPSADGVMINQHNEMRMNVFSETVNPPKNKVVKMILPEVQSTDYPPATWDPAYSGNHSTGGITPEFAVVHTVQGSFSGCISWFKNPAAQVSAHYVISTDGRIVQMVREHDKAWHVGCWNGYMLGCEHEGYVSDPKWYTEAMYQTSAGLYRHFAVTYGIPVDDNRIIGHDEHLNSQWVSWMRKNYPGIDPTCNSHTDPGQYWNWSHFYDLICADAPAPTVVSHEPSNTSDSLWANSPVKVHFDRAMNPYSIQNAFKIEPAVEGTFSWEDEGKTLVFTPAGVYQLGTEYTVTIDTNAESVLRAPLKDQYKFNFTTKQTSAVSVTDSYPVKNDTGISTTVKVMVWFSTPLKAMTLTGNVLFRDADNNQLVLKNAKYQTINGKGLISFCTLHQLDENAEYSLTINGVVQNEDGLALGSDYVLNFTTGKTGFVKGTVLDSLELLGGWQQPNDNTETVGVDPQLTNLKITTEQNVDGKKSAKIDYKFTGSNGMVSADEINPLALGSNQNYKFGIWIFGDLSSNFVDLKFTAGSESKIIPVDTLNYSGWKFIEVSFGSIAGSGDILFDGVRIKQNSSGADSGAVFVDAIQYRDPNATDVNEGYNPSLPSQYSLYQNYPNPFNPSTVIKYSIPSESYVTLKIFDMLGREVATLVNGKRFSGTYEVKFDAGNLASGIYLYQLKAGNFSATKKLILTK